MSDAEAAARTESEPAADATDGTGAAVARFLGQTELEFRYFLLAVALAVAWWQAIGVFSAFAAGLGFVCLSSGMQSVVSLVLSRRWPTVEGIVVESTVLTPREAREYATPGEDASLPSREPSGYVPLVRYEFTVDGTRYESARISPFDGPISRRHWAAAVVDRYPRGSPVSLRYDPADPTRSYVRPWVRSSSLVFSGVGLLLLAVGAWFAAGFPGGAPVAALGIGIPLTVLGMSRLVTGLRSRGWPTTTGVVTSTGVKTEGGGDDSPLKYVPELRYEYEADGQSYVSGRYSFGRIPSFGNRSEAESWLETNYPVDAEVAVHYDPDRPDRSVLEPGPRGALGIVVVGLAFTGLGIFTWLQPAVLGLWQVFG